MGASSRELIDIRMESQYYHELDEDIKSNMEIKSVFEDNWDEEFKKHESYNRIKKVSTTAYRELKDIEFVIRNIKKK